MDGTRPPKSSPDLRTGHSVGPRRPKRHDRHSIPFPFPLWIVGRYVSSMIWRPPHMRTLAQSVRDLAAGTSSRSVVEECLARIQDQAGEGRRVFLKVHTDQ